MKDKDFFIVHILFINKQIYKYYLNILFLGH